VEKLIYGLWRAQEADPVALAADLVGPTAADLLALDPIGLRINVEEPAGKIMRVGGPFFATVSLWLESLDGRGPYEAVLAGFPATAHGWLVTESVPRAYGANRTWPDGERSPGVSIVTVFDKKARLDDATFFAIWHGEHTPLSFEIHPLWLYVRNAVARAVTPGAPPVRSIVYEAVPTVEDLLDFDRFFGAGGSREKLKANIERVNAHLATFADTAGLETTPMAEYIFRTVST
jgi:hypothetical protein